MAIWPWLGVALFSPPISHELTSPTNYGNDPAMEIAPANNY